MFNATGALRKLGARTETPTATADVDVRAVEGELVDHERVEHVLVTDDPVTYERNGETTTLTEGESRVVFTNRRAFVVDDDASDPAVAVEFAMVDAVDVGRRLRGTRVAVRTSDAVLRFFPRNRDLAIDVVRAVEGRTGAWVDFYEAVTKLKETVEVVEAAVEDDRDPTPYVQRARTRIATARACVVHHERAPRALMESALDPIEEKLDRLRVEPRVDRIEAALHEAIDARKERRYEDAFAAILRAKEHVDLARPSLERVDVDLPDARKRLDNCEGNLVKGARIVLDNAEQACHRAMGADDLDDEVDAWDAALARYRGALAAGWEEFLGIRAEDLRYQLSWVVGNLVDALEARADLYETDADLLGEYHEDAVEHYGHALADVRRARDIAAEHPHLSPVPYLEQVERLEKKHELSRWEWGSVA